MRLFIFSIGLFLIVGCGAAPEPATPASPTDLALERQSTATVAADLPTITALPGPPLAPTALPTLTLTATATGTAAPLPSATTIPTAAPSETPTPTPVPTSEYTCRPLSELLTVSPNGGVVPGPWPAPSASPELVFNAFGTSNLIHLGFDVEGTPEYLAELLAVLDRRGVKSTMFILGSWAELYPNWVRTFDQRGHELANHTYSHGNMREMTPEQVVAELTQTEAIVQALTGRTTQPWLRPPFGSRSEASVQAAYEAGWTTVIWSGSTDDWRTEADAEVMCATLREGSYGGAILYSHTYRPDIPETIDRYIGEMQARGFRFVPMSILMAPDPTLYLTNP